MPCSEPCRLKKECKADACKFQGSVKTIKVDDVIDHEDFQAIFRPGETGHLIQPTAENKPKSTVTIVEYVRLSSYSPLFASLIAFIAYIRRNNISLRR
jgi:hypothetical protein